MKTETEIRELLNSFIDDRNKQSTNKTIFFAIINILEYVLEVEKDDKIHPITDLGKTYEQT